MKERRKKVAGKNERMAERDKKEKFELYSVKPCGNLNGRRKKSIESSSSETEFLGWARKRDFTEAATTRSCRRRKKKVTHEEEDDWVGR